MNYAWRQVWLLMAIIGVCMTTGSAQADSSTKDSQPVLLVLGDSISAGYGLEPQQGWVTLLAQRLQQRQLDRNVRQYRVVNASISGDTTSGGLSRLPALLQQYQPQLVLIELGANDGLRGTPLPVIERNLQRLVGLSQQSGAQVLLLGMRIPPSYGARYSNGFYQLFASVADQEEIAYLPFLLEGVGGVSELMQADGLHPNRKAQPLMLDNSWSVLEPLLGE